MIKILFIGDVVGEPGRNVLRNLVPQVIQSESIDFTIVNGENVAGGKGITPETAEEIFSIGIQAITLGNHTWARKEIEQIIDDPRIIRPANYPEDVPGKGWNIFTAKSGDKISVINLMGRVYMPLLECPFRTADRIIELVSQQTKNIFVDFHAEITSEKQAMGWYLDNRVSAVVGSHTHIQTADERILPQGTAYLTDVGMCGSEDGIIGMDREIVLKKYLSSLPQRFIVAKGNLILNGCIIEIDNITGKAINIKRVYLKNQTHNCEQ